LNICTNFWYVFSSNRHITNKHAATLARVDIHRQDDGDGYVEAWDHGEKKDNYQCDDDEVCFILD
jgi:predicted SnoaL-like aldol condensation-catalyzing enzyme